METESKILFDPIIDAIASTISYGTAPNTEKPFGDFIIKTDDNKSTPDLCKPDENPNLNLPESQKVTNDNLLVKEPSKSNDVPKTDIHGTEKLKIDQITHQELNKKSQLTPQVFNNLKVNTLKEKTTNSIGNIKSEMKESKKILQKDFKNIPGSNSDNKSGQSETTELSQGKITHRNIAGQIKPAAQSVTNDKSGSELQNTAQNSVQSGTVVSKSAQSTPANGIEVKQFSVKDVKSGQNEATELSQGKITHRNIAGQIKPAAQSVANDKSASELQNTARNSVQSGTVINKSAQSTPANGIEVKQFSVKDVKSGQSEATELSQGKITHGNIAGQIKPAAQSVANDKSGSELQNTARNSVQSGTVVSKSAQSTPANGIEVKQFSVKDVKSGQSEARNSVLSGSVNKNNSIQKKRSFIIDRKGNSTSTELISNNSNKVRSNENYYEKHLRGNFVSSENGSRFFSQDKDIFYRDAIPNPGKFKNIRDDSRLLAITGLHQTEQIESIQNQLITGARFSSAMMVQKISQVIFQSHEKQASEMNFILDGEQLGSLEIKYVHDSQGSQATIFVESETIRSLLDKVLPIINENLIQKGLMLASLDVQVGDFNKSKTQNENHQNDSGKSPATNISFNIDDKINQIIAIRDYGYNTIEVLA
ncbi:MAG TPA: hypothetical protein DHW42_09120 [Candidatus Marinimicrobia bacterium]|nr:hypothetical protein [Candidatus Neomarinimicrobiota bacterium]